MATATRPRARASTPAEKGQQPQNVLHMPVVHVPHVELPAVRMPAGTAGRVLWWGGLAAVAAFGVVDWPVAALVGAGTWVAEQHARSEEKRATGKET